MLNGTNFKTWHENLQIVLGVMDLDFTLRVSSPAPLTVESSSNEKRDIKRWEKSNRMCLMIIKKAISEAFRGTISEIIKTTKEFLEELKERRIKKLQRFHIKRNETKKKRLMVVAFVEL